MKFNKDMRNLVLVVFILINSFGYAQDQQKKDELYIRKYAKIAVEERINNKIPASIKLGQGLLETAFGQSELAQNANNHFGIKCKETWKGETYRYTDDAYMECFRKYPSAEESYKDHSQFLITRKHYANLFLLDITDYKGWAYGLKKAGYATNPKYAPILINRIEKLNLYVFDKIKLTEVNKVLDSLYPSTKGEYFNVENNSIEPNNSKQEIAKNESSNSNNNEVYSSNKPISKVAVTKKIDYIHPQERIKTHINKGVKYITLLEGEDIQSISKLYKINEKDLNKYNDTENNKLFVGQKIFFEEKENKGAENYYRVKKGDTMYKIAQEQAIKLSELYKKNNMSNGEEPKEGEIIYLRKNK